MDESPLRLNVRQLDQPPYTSTTITHFAYPPRAIVRHDDPTPPAIVRQPDQLPHYYSTTTTTQPLTTKSQISDQAPPANVRLGDRTTATCQKSSPTSSTGKHPNYHGIRCRNGKWVSEIREPRKTTRIWLGTYPTAEMAAAAYDVAAMALKGCGAILNFPEQANSYPLPETSSPKSIQKASAAAAAAAMMKVHVGDQNPTGVAVGHDQPETGTAGIHNHDDGFIDEEAIFDMPNLLVEMAEGLLMSPPWMMNSPAGDSPENSDVESLWGYF